MKILLVLPDDFTRVLLATPVIRCLRHRFPDAEMVVHTSQDGALALQRNPFVNAVKAVPDGDGVEAKALESFSAVIDLRAGNGSAGFPTPLRLVDAAARQKPLTAFFRRFLGLTTIPERHLVERYFETVAQLGVRNDGSGLDFVIPYDALVVSHDIPHSHHAGFLSIIIAASGNVGKLSVDKLRELCQKIHHPIVLLGGRENAIEGDAIASVDPIKIYNACGKFSVHERADLLRQSKLVIAHDSGMMHIAAALKKPLIVIGVDVTLSVETMPYYGKIFLQRNATACDDMRAKRMEKVDVNGIVGKVQMRLKPHSRTAE